MWTPSILPSALDLIDSPSCSEEAPDCKLADPGSGKQFLKCWKGSLCPQMKNTHLPGDPLCQFAWDSPGFSTDSFSQLLENWHSGSP